MSPGIGITWKNVCFIRVVGDPEGQPRPRGFARCIGGRYTTRVYTPSTADGWKQAIALAARKHVPQAALTGPVRVDILFLLARPQKLLRKSIAACRLPHTNKPDRDNLDKVVLDVLTKMGFWLDDKQVCAGEPAKAYVNINEEPGAEIYVSVDSKEVANGNA